jgi:hypothetical protein
VGRRCDDVLMINKVAALSWWSVLILIAIVAIALALAF